MKLEARLNADETMIEIVYDDVARLAFADAAKLALQMCTKRSVRRIIKRPPAGAVESLALGTKVLRYLAFEPSNSKSFTTDRRKPDLDGMASTVLDCLVRAGALPDDNRFEVDRLIITAVDCKHGDERLEVEIG